MNRNSISTTQLAKICGVSQGTVDRALNNRKGINKLTKEKVLSVAKEYGYRPGIQGRGVIRQQLKVIGIILPDLNNPALVETAEKIKKLAQKKGFSTVVMFNSTNCEEEVNSILTLYHMGIKGLIFIPLNSGDDFERFLSSLDLPIVTVNNRINSIPYMGSFDTPQATNQITDDNIIDAALAYIIDGATFPFNSVES